MDSPRRVTTTAPSDSPLRGRNNSRGRSRSPPLKKPVAKAAGRRPAGGGMAASLFGRAVRDAQRSIKKTQEPQDRPPPERHRQVSPPAERSRQESPPEKPKLVPRSPAGRSKSSSSGSRSRSRNRSPPHRTTGAEPQASPRVRGRAGTLAAAMANAVASTASTLPHGARSLPPRPRRPAPGPPPPRGLPMHMQPGATMMGHPEGARFAHDGRWGPPHLPHGAAPYHGGPPPGPPPTHAPPPAPGPPPLGPPPVAAASTRKQGKARLAPVKLEDPKDDHDPSRWHFQAPPGQHPAGLPPILPHPLVYPHPVAYPPGPLPHQMVAGAPGYPTWTQVSSPPPLAMLASVRPHAAPPPLVSTVFEFQPTPAAVAAAQPAPAPTPQRLVSAPARPRNFVPQKWRVVTPDLVVVVAEHVDSKQVRILREGEIVESVGPPFTLTNGVVRLEIRHPSSAAYPNPIGWVTQDGSATGGTKNLEPGPQPVQAAMREPPPPSFSARPPSYKGGKGGWHGGKGAKGAGKSAKFTNVSWRPP